MEVLSSVPEPPPPRQAALSVQGLRKTFGALTALNDLSFDVDKGEIFGIAGPKRRGQDHALEPLYRRAGADVRTHFPRGRPRGRIGALTPLSQGAGVKMLGQMVLNCHSAPVERRPDGT